MEVSLTKNILATLEIFAAVSAIDTRIQKKLHGCRTIMLIISNEETNGIKKDVQIEMKENGKVRWFLIIISYQR